jgi:hypothetical protein
MKVKLSLLFFLFCISAYGFEIKTINEISPEAFLRWDVSDGPVVISLDANGSADLPLSSVQQALERSLDAWQNVSNQSLRFQYGGSIQLAEVSSSDHKNTISWKEKNWEYSSTAAAVTIYSYYLDDPPTMADADIVINGDDFRWGDSTDNSGKRLNVELVLLHELGHLLGLAHSSEQKAVMYPYVSAEVGTLALDDRAGLRFLYGSEQTSLRLITPVRKALYVEEMAAKGLPLPVLRWGPGSVPDYVIQFSNGRTFATRIQIHVGPQQYYQLTAKDEQRLLKLSEVRKLYWRVLSEGQHTNTRVIRFAPLDR